ncbi:MAG: lytic murein transglycosylase [Candidatus Kapaibacteriales bacterium]
MESIKEKSFSTTTLIFFIILGLLLVQYKISYTNNGNKKLKKFYFFQPVADSLFSLGIDSESVYLLINDYRTFFSAKYINLNVIKHSKFPLNKEEISNSVVKKLLSFISSNYSLLLESEKKFKIPKEVIASILWTETRFGAILGTHHVPSVFLSIAISPFIIERGDSEQIEILTDSKYQINKFDTAWEKLLRRSKEKSQMALKEIIALLEMKKSGFDIQNLYGSFAGAFGIPQFLPSSFIQYGYDANGDGKVDLFSLPDAIFSVANYLNSKGWDNNSIEKQRQALFSYNKSINYVDFILKLAKKLQNKI